MRKTIFPILLLTILICAMVQISAPCILLQPECDSYIFSSTEINHALNEQKNEIIKTAHKLISQKNYYSAKTLLENSPFKEDKTINSLLEIVNNNILKTGYNNYTEKIDVLCFEPIISFPEMLSKSSAIATEIDENQITINEFEKILYSLYEKNYILISPSQSPILIPAHKKPLILLLEHTNYDIKNGSADKIILSEDNEIITYTSKRSINDRIHHNNDFVTMLNSFIDLKPDFALDNAHGTICIDGSKGIFGYKTYKSNANSKQQIKKCYRLIDALKDNGWNIASRGYKYGINDGDVNFASGLSHWREIVEPITGKTQIYYGDFSKSNDYKNSLLSSYGYDIILDSNNANGSPYNIYNVSGKTLRENSTELSKFFDPERVYDHINRTITYSLE